MAASLWKTMLVAVALLAYAGVAQAGTRADLSGDAVIDFTTTMDMPFMDVGNPGNAADTRYGTPGCGAVDNAFRMGKFEVTAGQYAEFLNAVAKTDTYGLYNEHMADPVSHLGCNIQRSNSSGSYSYSVAADWADRPVNYVSWGDSARFANWLTNGMPTGAQGLATTEDGSYLMNGAMSDAELLAVTRKSSALYVIPTEDEWYKAAYHKNDGATGNYFDYPTSSDSTPSNDLIDPDPGNNACFYIITGGDYTIGSPYYRTEVGEFENSESPYETFDMGGNLWEWNETILYGDSRGIRGGSFNTIDTLLWAGYQTGFNPAGENAEIGLRIAEVPEPVTMAALALGGIGMLKRRRSV